MLIVASQAKDHWKSISVGKEFFEKLGAENHFSVDFTGDTSKINDANLAKYQVFVMFHLAPFDMSASQQAALQKFVEQGKGWVGIHAAGLTGDQFIGPNSKAPYWKWFEGFMGGVIYSPHPAFQDGLVVVEDHNHPDYQRISRQNSGYLTNGMSTIKVRVAMYACWQLLKNQLINKTNRWEIILLSGLMRAFIG